MISKEMNASPGKKKAIALIVILQYQLINPSSECPIIMVICVEFAVQKGQDANSVLEYSRMSQKEIKLPKLSSSSSHRQDVHKKLQFFLT
jgi:hypothetical protein